MPTTPRRRRDRRRLHLLASLLVAVVLVLAPAGTASAHAELLTSTPGDGTVLDQAPKTVSLQFSEGVSVRPDGVRVVDADGTRVDRGKADASGSDVDVPLEADLAEGSYLVSWRVVSADGHPVRGAFTFSIGKETRLEPGLAASAFAGSADKPYEVAAGVLRALAYVGALGAAGLVVVGGLLHRDDEPTPVSRFAGALAAVGLFGVLAQIPVQAALATGEGIGAVAEAGNLGLAISDGVGWAALFTGLGLVGILVAVGLPFNGIPRRVAAGGAAVAPVGFAITGHTRTMHPLAAGYAADVVHLLAGAIWFGGLLALVATVRRRRAGGDVPGAADAVARFSGMAAVSLLLLAVAGTVLGLIEVGSLHALTSTTYGKVLLVKVGVVAAVAALAAWNRFRLVGAVTARSGDAPADRPVDDRAWAALRRVVSAEAFGIVVVLALTGALVNITPARTAVPNGPVTVEAPLGSGTVEVIVDPARPGRNDVHAYVLDAQGRADDSYQEASFSLSLPAQSLGPLERTPVSVGRGHFRLVGTELSPAGTWKLTITVKPDRFTEQKATVTFKVR